jgi:hypothetical protein
VEKSASANAKIAYRGTPEHRKMLKVLAAQRDTSIQKIIDDAVEAYLSGKAGLVNEDPSLTPQTKTERRIVAAVLHFIWDEGSVELMPILDALLEESKRDRAMVEGNPEEESVSTLPDSRKRS